MATLIPEMSLCGTNNSLNIVLLDRSNDVSWLLAAVKNSNIGFLVRLNSVRLFPLTLRCLRPSLFATSITDKLLPPTLTVSSCA